MPDTGARTAEQCVLSLAGVSLAYPGEGDALKEISFAIAHGEAIALCGANGSGKTTLLKLIAGLLAPTRGLITLEGESLDARSRREAFRTVGFLFQDSEDQLFCPTVAEDIAYGPTNLGLSAIEVAERVERVMGVLQIHQLANRPIHHLSGGEKKRVALAGILAMDTKVIVLDEPTSGLDPAGARSLIASLVMLNRQYGHTLIVATHEVDRIPEFATRVVLLKDGEVFRDGRPTEILTDDAALQQAGLEAPIITRYFNHRAGCGGRLPLTLAEALEMTNE